MVKSRSVLDGIRVLDLGRHHAGPRCGLILSRLGAEVIHIEQVGGAEERGSLPMVRGESLYWPQSNSGKKSLTLNLRHPIGREILRRLIKVSDILLQNFRPGVMDKMGFGYDVLRELNPRIIMVNVSGYGQYGTYSDRPAFDTIGQAMSGFMSLTGFPENPPTRAGLPIIDRITALHATIGALAALWERETSQEGQAIDVSLLDSGYSLMEIPIANYLETGQVGHKRHGNRSMGGPSNAFKARDGWVYITAASRNTFRRLCDLIGKPEWSNDPTFVDETSRAELRDVIESEIERWVADKTVEEVVRLGDAGEIPIAPVNDVAAAAKDPYLLERELLVKVRSPIAGELYASGKIIKFSRSNVIVGPVAAPGEHTEEILVSLLGYSDQDVRKFKEDGVV